MIFKFVSEQTENYENVVRITCKGDNDSLLTIDVHKIFYDILKNSESCSFSLDFYDTHNKDYDYYMNAITIENDSKKLFLSGHGLLLLLEGHETFKYVPDDTVLCHFKIL